MSPAEIRGLIDDEPKAGVCNVLGCLFAGADVFDLDLDLDLSRLGPTGKTWRIKAETINRPPEPLPAVSDVHG